MASPIKENLVPSKSSAKTAEDLVDQNSITPPMRNDSILGETTKTSTVSGSGSGSAGSGSSAVVAGSAWLASEKGKDGVWMSTPEKPFSKINAKTKEIFSGLSLKQREQQLLYAETNPPPPSLKEAVKTRRASNESK